MQSSTEAQGGAKAKLIIVFKLYLLKAVHSGLIWLLTVEMLYEHIWWKLFLKQTQRITSTPSPWCSFDYFKIHHNNRWSNDDVTRLWYCKVSFSLHFLNLPRTTKDICRHKFWHIKSRKFQCCDGWWREWCILICSGSTIVSSNRSWKYLMVRRTCLCTEI